MKETTALQKDEYLDVSNNIRSWAQIRFAQMTLFVTITAGILFILFQSGALSSSAGQMVFKIGALIIVGIFWFLDERVMLYQRGFLKRAIDLEKELGFRQYSDAPSRKYFNSNNAIRALYLVILVFWFITLIWPTRF